MDKKLITLRQSLAKTHTEEDVKSTWAKYLGLDYDTSDDHDLYTPQVSSVRQFGQIGCVTS